MATNPFIHVLDKTNTNEQKLVKDLFAEAIQFYGVDVIYLPRSLQKRDDVFNEDVLSNFTQHYTIEAYIESIEGFEGDGDLLEAIGLTINDRLVLNLSQDRFRTETKLDTPVEGDLIFFKFSEPPALFEIKYVEWEDQFYPVGTSVSFKLTCERFQIGEETFTTGIPEIDVVDDKTTDALGDTVKVADENSDNVTIENEGIQLIDFSESNPFGMP